MRSQEITIIKLPKKMPGDHIQNLQMQSLRPGFPQERESALNMCQTWRERSHLVAKCSHPLMKSRLHLKSRRMEGATKEPELSSPLETTGSLPPAPDQDAIGKGAHRRPWL